MQSEYVRAEMGSEALLHPKTKSAFTMSSTIPMKTVISGNPRCLSPKRLSFPFHPHHPLSSDSQLIQHSKPPRKEAVSLRFHWRSQALELMRSRSPPQPSPLGSLQGSLRQTPVFTRLGVRCWLACLGGASFLQPTGRSSSFKLSS